MFGLFDNVSRATLLFATAKTVAVVGLLSLAAANWLAGGGLDQSSLARLASQAGGVADPLTTGSLGARAAAQRLDPCTGERR